MSGTTFTYEFKSEALKGRVSVSFPTGVFINGEFSAGEKGTTIDVINPANAKIITSVDEATQGDVCRAVSAARKAFDNSWGLKVSGEKRGEYLNKLANLMVQHLDELAAIEALDTGKAVHTAKTMDLEQAVRTIRYFAGWADKIHGQAIETREDQLVYTRHEPFGVVGQILPSSFPLLVMAWKLGPALAMGNCVVLKPSELTPLTALRMCSLIQEAEFPPGVVNVVTGFGHTVGTVIAEHMDIDKISFTGSTGVGQRIMRSAAESNLKDVTLELGGKSPNIVFDDADLDCAADCLVHGMFANHGQTCCGGSRIFVHSKIYNDFLRLFTEKTKSLKIGDPFASETYQCPQVSQAQFEHIMHIIQEARTQGATVHLGGERYGTQGYWVQPTIITNTRPEMDIVKQEVFGPVAVVIKFEDENKVLKLANDPLYGLAASFFTNKLQRGVQVANKLQAGTVWVNCMNMLHPGVPYGGFKNSGIGRECGKYALDTYTNVKSVYINAGKCTRPTPAE